MYQKEEEFIQAIKTGDSSGLRQIYEMFLPRIQNLVTSNGGSKDDAKDVFQSAILTIYEKVQKENFKLIDHGQDIDSLFSTKFDIILSRQVLYYLSNTELKRTLEQFNKMLNPGGYVYFTMMGTQNYYYNFAKTEKNDDLQEVTLSGRLNETTYINFVENEEQLSKMFEIFKPEVIGYYDMVLPNEGSTFHYYFVGKKSSS